MHVLMERPVLRARTAHAARGPGKTKGENPSDDLEKEIQKTFWGAGEATGRGILGVNGEHKYFLSHFLLVGTSSLENS